MFYISGKQSIISVKFNIIYNPIVCFCAPKFDEMKLNHTIGPHCNISTFSSCDALINEGETQAAICLITNNFVELHKIAIYIFETYLYKFNCV